MERYNVFLVVFSLCVVFCSGNVLPAVRELTDRDFQSTLQNNPNVLVTFYSPGCPHCVRFLPELDRTATTLSSSMLVAKVNCAAGGRQTCSQSSVKSVPTIRTYRNGQPQMDYNGERNAESVANYAMSSPGNNMVNNFQTPTTYSGPAAPNCAWTPSQTF